MDFSQHTVCQFGHRSGACSSCSHISFHDFLRRLFVNLSGSLLLLGFLISYRPAHAAGDAEKGRYHWEYTCQHCHGVPQPNSASAFSDYGTTANRLALYASDPAAITKAATDGYTIPQGNSNDKAEPGQSTNIPMGTWAGLAPNRLGLAGVPTQYAMDFSAYFATFFQVPAAPGITAVSAGNGQATVSFTVPQSDLTITSYAVTANPGGITATGSASPITVNGLSNGVTYTFAVRATSNAGTGKLSSASKAVMPLAPAATVTAAKPQAPGVLPAPQAVNNAKTLPIAPSPVLPAKSDVPVGSIPVSSSLPAPIITAAKPGNAEVRVFFAAPQNGLVPITGYTVKAYLGGVATAIKASGPGSPITVKGLTNGMDYTFTVTANGKTGAGSTSAASNVVTPLDIFGD